MVYLSRKTHFSSAHRYYQPSLSKSENKKIYGACYTEHGHGHNYSLEVTIGGEIDPETGMVMNLVDVDQILKTVTTPLDHQHLNFDIPYFSEEKNGQVVVPTTENIARYVWLEITKLMPKSSKLIRVRLFEAEDLWVDYFG